MHGRNPSPRKETIPRTLKLCSGPPLFNPPVGLQEDFQQEEREKQLQESNIFNKLTVGDSGKLMATQQKQTAKRIRTKMNWSGRRRN